MAEPQSDPEEQPINVALLHALFDKIFALDVADTPPRVFPRGISSIEVRSGDFEVRITAPAATAGAPLEELEAIDQDAIPSFNAEGHATIAEIMKADLQASAPQTWQKIQDILDNGQRELHEAANFPDAIRQSRPETKPFHFVDIPFDRTTPPNPPLPPTPHVLSKIPEFTADLQNATNDQDRVDALSWLIHLFGDVHQPLHCIEHISDLHPGGDAGGNSFKLGGGRRNLHSLWDNSVDPKGRFTNPPDLATDIMGELTRTSLVEELKGDSPEAWARASYALAKTNAYSLDENPAHPPTPTAAYIANTERIGRRQAALAGYRLADHLKKIL